MAPIFFSEYSQFTATSRVAPQLERLNLRYEAMISANEDILAGARVLDLAAHDGRWSFAALKSGAAHVTGIEARQELVRNARENFSYYQVDPQHYEFVHGDVFEALQERAFKSDVVLCLGYFYHTWRFTELLSHIRRIDPEFLILDTQVLPKETKPVVRLRVDDPKFQGTAVLDAYSHNSKTAVGRPSVTALRMLLELYDFGIEHVYDWQRLIAESPEARNVGDYANGERVTLRCRTGISSTQIRPQPRPSRATAASEATETPEDAPPDRPAHHRGRHVVNRVLGKTTGYELRRVRSERN